MYNMTVPANNNTIEFRIQDFLILCMKILNSNKSRTNCWLTHHICMVTHLGHKILVEILKMFLFQKYYKRSLSFSWMYNITTVYNLHNHYTLYIYIYKSSVGLHYSYSGIEKRHNVVYSNLKATHKTQNFIMTLLNSYYTHSCPCCQFREKLHYICKHNRCCHVHKTYTLQELCFRPIVDVQLLEVMYGLCVSHWT